MLLGIDSKSLVFTKKNITMQSLGLTLVLALAINYFKLNLLCLIPLQATQTEFSYKKIISNCSKSRYFLY